MSLIFSSRKQPKKSCDIAKRDMSLKKKVIRWEHIVLVVCVCIRHTMAISSDYERKVQELPDDGKAKVTTSWTIEHNCQVCRISFSRDNLHVWINSYAVETTSYISDKGYDVDLFFDIDENSQGHIYSDVEGDEMMNYLLINGEMKGKEYMSAKDMK